jgi:hypothetical protein
VNSKWRNNVCETWLLADLPRLPARAISHHAVDSDGRENKSEHADHTEDDRSYAVAGEASPVAIMCRNVSTVAGRGSSCLFVPPMLYTSRQESQRNHAEGHRHNHNTLESGPEQDCSSRAMTSRCTNRKTGGGFCVYSHIPLRRSAIRDLRLDPRLVTGIRDFPTIRMARENWGDPANALASAFASANWALGMKSSA